MNSVNISNALPTLSAETTAADISDSCSDLIAGLADIPSISHSANAIAVDAVNAMADYATLWEEIGRTTGSILVHPWLEGVGQRAMPNDSINCALSSANALQALANKCLDTTITVPNAGLDAIVIVVSGHSITKLSENISLLNAVLAWPELGHVGDHAAKVSHYLATVDATDQLTAPLPALLKIKEKPCPKATQILNAGSRLTALVDAYHQETVSPVGELSALLTEKNIAKNTVLAEWQSIKTSLAGGAGSGCLISAGNVLSLASEIKQLSPLSPEQPFCTAFMWIDGTGDLDSWAEILGVN